MPSRYEKRGPSVGVPRGVTAGLVDVHHQHLPDREQLTCADADGGIHLLEELLQPRAVGHQRRVVAQAAHSRCRFTVGQRQGLADQVDHVHPEAVDATLHPPVHHRVDGLAHLRVLPVQVRLLPAEQVQEILTTSRVELPGRAHEVRAPVRRLGARSARSDAVPWWPPDVPIPLRGGRIAGFYEPRMFIRGVVHHQVHDQLHAALVQRTDQFVHVLQRAEQRIDVGVIADVVAVVVLRRT